MWDNLESIRSAGFCGFVPIREFRANKLRDVPNEMGVYLVLRLNSEAPIFLERSPAGHFTGKAAVGTVHLLRFCPQYTLVTCARGSLLHERRLSRSALGLKGDWR